MCEGKRNAFGCSFLISAIKERLMPYFETSEFMLLPVPSHSVKQVCSAVVGNHLLHDSLKQQASTFQLTYRQLNAELRKYTIFSEANFLVSVLLNSFVSAESDVSK